MMRRSKTDRPDNPNPASSSHCRHRARFYASGFDIHGHGPTRSLVGNNQIVSNIEATPSLKLYDLWLEQRLPGRISIRLGQEGANDEMMTSAFDALYLNSSFGFPG